MSNRNIQSLYRESQNLEDDYNEGSGFDNLSQPQTQTQLQTQLQSQSQNQRLQIQNQRLQLQNQRLNFPNRPANHPTNLKPRQSQLQPQNRRQTPLQNDTSIQELLKADIYSRDNSVLDGDGFKFQLENASSDMTTIARIDKFGVSDRYFFIDTLNQRFSEVTTDGKIVFYINRIANLEPIENIIEMEVSPFLIERKTTINGVNVGHNQNQPAPTDQVIEYVTEDLISEQISILFEEMSAQATNASNDVKFHFLLDATTDKKMPMMRYHLDSQQSKKFIFTKPVQSVTQLTMVFRNPTVKYTISNPIVEGYFESPPPPIGIPPQDADYSQGILWLRTISSLTEYIIGGLYHIIFTDVSQVKLGLTNNNLEFNTLAFLTNPQGFIGKFEIINPGISTEALPYPPLVGQSATNTWYSYFRIYRMGVYNSVGTTTRTMRQLLNPNELSYVKFALSHKRTSFELRLRTLRGDKTNRITPV
jgi:hypothetical protein